MLRAMLGLILIFSVGSQIAAQEPSEAFRKFDKNGDGKVTSDEFSGPLFKQIDANQDGTITAEEDVAFNRRRVANAPPAMKLPETVTAHLDLPYAATENTRQRLDLYLPKKPQGDKPLPLVVFIHGGGWQGGDKRGGWGLLARLVESGNYVGASVGYRLTGEAIWPAQIHDCKAAIRWLRAHAKQYNIDPQKIGVTGTSAGGHLVAMLGTSGDVEALEGKLGEHTNESSRVTCVIDQFGPTDLLTMGGSHNNPNAPGSKLIGGALQEHAEAARNASPSHFVSKDDAPFLFIHGTKDTVVPLQQSELLHAALQKAGVESHLVPVEGGGHGGFKGNVVQERIRQFFDKHLHGKEVTLSTEPIVQ